MEYIRAGLRKVGLSTVLSKVGLSYSGLSKAGRSCSGLFIADRSCSGLSMAGQSYSGLSMADQFFTCQKKINRDLYLSDYS